MARTAATSRLAMRGFGNQSLRFDGANDYVDFGTTDFNFERNQAFSISMWVNIENFTSGNKVIFSRASGTTAFRGWWIRFENSNSINFYMANDFAASNYLWVRGNAAIPFKSWIRICFTYDGSSAVSGINFYLNGVSSSMSTVRDTLTTDIAQAGTNTRMGLISDLTIDYSGFVTDTAVYNRVLTAAEVANIHFCGIYPTDSLYGLYKFTDGSGATLTDSSVNARHGTITSATWSTTYAPLQTSRTIAPSARSVAASTQNLVTYSEQLDNAAWTKLNVTITANATTAPDGTSTADKVLETTATGNHTPYRNNVYTSSNNHLTYSVYLKAAERTWARVFIYVAATNTYHARANFDLTNGVIGSTTEGTSKIESAGNGWYRCSVTGLNVTGTVSPQTYLFSDAGTTTNYTGDAAKGIYAWGDQLVQANWNGPYVQTTGSTVNTGNIRNTVL